MYEIAGSALLILSIVLSIQGVFNLYLMLYAWENPRRIEKNRSPRIFERPQKTFTAIIPARHEESVIGDTIRAVSRIDYPPEMTEILVVLRIDDPGTIAAAEEAIQTLSRQHAKVVIFEDTPINKPHGLNFALKYAKNEIVVVFDAEDEPHKNIYNIVNTIIVKEKADVVQSGVQLINFHSNWYSTFNVIEYFFWFKSCLQYFANQGVIPLGGNTVFFSREKLIQVKGWDEHCLTEDADIGIKLSLAGAKINVVYDEEHATQEETPPTLESFIKQRTRWNQGFMQIIDKGQWRRLPGLKHKLLALYVLGWPLIQAFLFILMPLSLLLAIFVRFPVLVTLISVIPIFLLILQMSVAIIGLWEFTKDYKLRFPLSYVLKMFVSFLPYQFLLGYASLRAVYRFMKSTSNWEKTEHINAHREKRV
jgi:cellulose synthase/poly-beta-1,6-N-acetylglucosamine synthase-like glycosyltransferase